ncbi:MAG: hypothetical protein AAF387_16785 [Pseudomonadota bacterium]
MTGIYYPSPSPMTALMGAVAESFTNPKIVRNVASPRHLAPVFPSLAENSIAYDELASYLDKRSMAAVSHVLSLSFLKTLVYVDASLVFPVWRSRYKHKSKRSEVSKVIRFLKSRELKDHEITIGDYLSPMFVSQKPDWARYCFSMMLDLGLIRLYRQKIYHDGLSSPIAVRAVRKLYERRLSYLDLNERAWCEEGASLSPNALRRATKSFQELLDSFKLALQEQAKVDAMLVANFNDRQIGSVKKIAIENYFLSNYYDLFVSTGLSTPRYSWQLKSILSSSVAAKLIADYV